LLQQLTKRVLEAALDGEITDHLGYDKHDPAGKNGGNSRNGARAKTVLTDVGPVEVSVPRDRDGSFEPQIVRKRQRRLSGVEDMVLSLSAKGLTTGEISAHLAEVYGAQVSRQTISTITDKVMDGMAEWQNRPLDAVYPVVFLDAINVKIRDGKVANRPVYVALAVTVEGTRDILGLWAGDGGEGAKFWFAVCTELRNRGVSDVLMAVCDGLKGLPDAIAEVWPRTVVQTCVVHLLRNVRREAPVLPNGGGMPSSPSRRSGSVKLAAACCGKRRGGWQAAATKSGRARTARWCVLGERDGKVHARNQR
jgi:transposase-like protein